MKNWNYKEQLYEHYKERYFKLTVWKIQGLILMIKMIWKRKLMSWLGCMKQCKIKLKTGSYSEQIQILILLPDKWSRNYCSEYAFEYLVWTHMKSK